MFFIKCDNATFKVEGNQRYIQCKKTGDKCHFQRYCSQKNNFELGPTAENCILNPKNVKEFDVVDNKETPIEIIEKKQDQVFIEKQNNNKKNKNEKYIKPKTEEADIEAEITSMDIIEEIESQIEDEILEDVSDDILEDIGTLEDAEDFENLSEE